MSGGIDTARLLALADAALAAACDPGTVRALCEAVQAAQRLVERYRSGDFTPDDVSAAEANLREKLAPFAAGDTAA